MATSIRRYNVIPVAHWCLSDVFGSQQKVKMSIGPFTWRRPRQTTSKFLDGWHQSWIFKVSWQSCNDILDTTNWIHAILDKILTPLSPTQVVGLPDLKHLCPSPTTYVPPTNATYYASLSRLKQETHAAIADIARNGIHYATEGHSRSLILITNWHSISHRLMDRSVPRTEVVKALRSLRSICHFGPWSLQSF